MEVDHEIFSTVILLLIQEGFVSVTRDSMCAKYLLTYSGPGRVAQSEKCLTAEPGPGPIPYFLEDLS